MLNLDSAHAWPDSVASMQRPSTLSTSTEASRKRLSLVLLTRVGRGWPWVALGKAIMAFRGSLDR